MDEDQDETTSVQSLLAAVREPNSDGIEEAAGQVITAGLAEAAAPELLALLAGESAQTNSDLRKNAILTLGLLRERGATAALGERLLKDPDIEVRRVALGVLESLDPKGAVLFFQQASERPQEDPSIQQAALVSLGIGVRDLVQDAEDGLEPALQTLLESVKPESLKRLLHMPITVADTQQVTFPEAAAAALGLIKSQEARQTLCGFLHEEQARLAVEDRVAGDENRLQGPDTGKTRVFLSVVGALRAIGTEETVPCLGEALNNLSPTVRRLAAEGLGKLGYEQGIRPVAEAFLSDADRDVWITARNALSQMTQWEVKVNEVTHLLRDARHQRRNIQTEDVIIAISPPQTLNHIPHLLTDHLIDCAVQATADRTLASDTKQQFVAILADLVVHSANGSRVAAAERIDAYREAHRVGEEKLLLLRAEIGGVRVLSPLLTQLGEDNRVYFRDPIMLLNNETSTAWRRTINIALAGFGLRAVLSLVLFGIGAYLVLSAYQQVSSNQQTTAVFFGPELSFFGGLLTMFATVFFGPLKEIRKAVTDVGTANAAFIAYIHHILQVSHTFSYLYLDGKMSFEELEKANLLINRTSMTAVKLLYTDTSDLDLNQVLSTHFPLANPPTAAPK